VAELLISGITLKAILHCFDANQFETDEQIRQGEIRQDEIVAIDGVEGDITFSADLGIGAAWTFKVDRQWSDGKGVGFGFHFGGILLWKLRLAISEVCITPLLTPEIPYRFPE
jgi:hypothetical protein